jgi:hypothetical protein
LTDDVRFSMLRLKLLMGLGAAEIGGVTASAVGRAAPAGAQESKSGAVLPRRSLHSRSIIRCSTSGTWRRYLISGDAPPQFIDCCGGLKIGVR